MQRDVDIHLAFVLEIDVFAPIQNRNCGTDLFGALHLRVAEVRVRDQRHARRYAELTRHRRRLQHDLRQLRRIWEFRDGCVADEEGAALHEDHRHAHDALARGGIDDFQNVIQRCGVVARDSGDHAIRVAVRDHAGAEDVAVEVH